MRILYGTDMVVSKIIFFGSFHLLPFYSIISMKQTAISHMYASCHSCTQNLVENYYFFISYASMGRTGGISSKVTIAYSQGERVDFFIIFCVHTLWMLPVPLSPIRYTWHLILLHDDIDMTTCNKMMTNPSLLFSW